MHFLNPQYSRGRSVRSRVVRSRVVRAVLLASLFLIHSHAVAGNGWHKVLEKDGVVVFQRTSPGQDLPTLRGKTTMNANIFEILAVLQDIKRQPEWIYNCVQARVIQKISDNERIIYSLTDAPWPASDRDSVARTKFRILEGAQRIRLDFRSVRHPKVPEIPGVVRVPRFRGHYDLKILPDGRSQVLYQFDSNPGGAVPRWLAAQESQKVPVRMLRSLRAQVKKTRGQYQAFIDRWSPRG